MCGRKRSTIMHYSLNVVGEANQVAFSKKPILDKRKSVAHPPRGRMCASFLLRQQTKQG